VYEHRSKPPVSRRRFLKRVLLHVAAAVALLLGSIGIGMAGYIYYEHLAWRDAFLNTAMLLGGMGPVDPPRTNGGKLFAGCYALYAGLVFLITAALIFTPVLHRLLHKLHWDQGT
jgi:hypothetical protein